MLTDPPIPATPYFFFIFTTQLCSTRKHLDKGKLDLRVDILVVAVLYTTIAINNCDLLVGRLSYQFVEKLGISFPFRQNSKLLRIHDNLNPIKTLK